jgi:hypothetical protein
MTSLFLPSFEKAIPQDCMSFFSSSGFRLVQKDNYMLAMFSGPRQGHKFSNVHSFPFLSSRPLSASLKHQRAKRCAGFSSLLKLDYEQQMSVFLPPRLSKTQLQTEYELLTPAFVLRKCCLAVVYNFATPRHFTIDVSAYLHSSKRDREIQGCRPRELSRKLRDTPAYVLLHLFRTSKKRSD